MPKVRTATIHKLEFLQRDRGYRFADRDPQMEELCDLIDDSGMSILGISNAVYKATGGAYAVSDSTIYNWLRGKTKRPQNHTMNWVGYALGYERKWKRIR